MIVNEEQNIEQQVVSNQPNVNTQNTIDPDPPIDVDKAVEYFKSKLDGANRKYNEKTLYKYAARKDLKTFIRSWHATNGFIKSMPNEQEADSIYNSWIDKSAIEKKNLDQTILDDFSSQPNVATDSEQPSTSGNGKSSSDSNLRNSNIVTYPLTNSDLDRILTTTNYDLRKYDLNAWKHEIDIKGASSGIDESKYLKSVIESIPSSIFNKGEAEAALYLQNKLRVYGYEVEEDEPGANKLKITTPDGRTNTFRLFTPIYKLRLGFEQSEKEIKNLEEKRFGELKNFLLGAGPNGDVYGRTYLIDGMANQFATSQNLIYDVSSAYASAIETNQGDLEFLATAINQTPDYFYTDGVFDVYKVYRTIDEIKSGLSGKLKEFEAEDLRLEQKEKMSDEVTKVSDNTRVKIPNLKADSLLRIRKPFKERDTSNDGLIKATNRRLDNIIYSLRSKQQTASKLLGGAMAVSGRYNDIDLFDPQVLMNLQQAGLRMEDMPLDGIKINGVPSTVNTLQEIITDPGGRDAVILGDIKIEISDNPKEYGLLSSYISGAKKLVERNEAEAAPNKALGYLNIGYNWLEDLTQSIGIGGMEIFSNVGVLMSDMFQMAGMDEVGADMMVFGNFGLPTMRMPHPMEVQMMKENYLPLWETQISDADSFGEMLALANQPMGQSIPYFAAYAINPTFGLATTFTSTYGQTLTELDNLKLAARNALEDGATLTESQKKLLNQSDGDARLIALSQSTSETVITRLFTYRYFKGLSGAKNFKGPKTLENSRKMAESFSKLHGNVWRKNIANFLGVSTKSLSTEVPEEELVAFSKYFIDIAWGLDEWDEERAAKMFKNVGLQATFTSTGMAKIGQINHGRQVRNHVDAVIKKNINLESDKELIQSRNQADAMVIELKEKGGLETPSGKELEKLLNQLNARVLESDKMKSDLVKNMSATDKQAFLDNIVLLETKQAALDDNDKGNAVKRRIAEDITNIQNDLRNILTRYPSELTYSFLDSNVKLEYVDAASKELQQEAEEKGGDYTITEEQINKRAAEIYVNDVNNKKAENRIKFDPAEPYTVTDPTKYFVDVPEEEINAFDLNDAISKSKSKREPEAEQKDLFEQQPVGTEEAMLRLPKPETTNKRPLDNERVASVLDRFTSANLDVDFMSTLPKGQQEHVVQFFKDLDAGKNPSFGYVEAILNANDIAVETAARTAEKIKIFDFGKPLKEMSAAEAYKWMNAFTQKYFTVGSGITKDMGFGTADIILKTMFRNNYVGEKFINLYRGIVRKVDEQTTITAKQYKDALKKYENSVKAYNKKNGTTIDTNPNSLENSYELYMLAGAFRQSGILDDSGVDLEFGRWKGLLKQELDLRQQEYNDTQSKETKERYETWKKVYDKLGVTDAKSFSDLKGNQFNIDILGDIAGLQRGDDALNRISDYGGKLNNEDRGTEVPFVDGTYIPIPLRKPDTGALTPSIPNTIKQTVNGVIGPTKIEPVSVRDASSLNEINFVETLGDNARLNPGIFFKNTFMRMQGSNIDIEARGDMTTLMYLLENPTFSNMFADKAEYQLMKNYFSGKQDIFNEIVTKGNNTYVDIGTEGFGNTFKKMERAVYSSLSAKALARIDQRAAQFFSAMTGTSPYLKSRAARNHHNLKQTLFLVGLSGASNGTQSKTWIGKQIQNSMLGSGDLSNIYSKSRTNVRNALKAEFVLEDNSEIPTDYVLDYLGIKMEDENGQVKQVLGEKTTINAFADFLSSGSELALDVFLASADRSAANASFEAHYIEARVKQGENLDGVNMKEWWKKENENPNIDAINQADALVAQTMRQTGKMSEASIYTKGGITQTAVRTFIPFQRFITNARANFRNQYAILMDPTIPPAQKQEARKAMQGIVQEVASFTGVKLFTGVSMIQGFTQGILMFGVEEEDKKRYGGYSQLIGSDLLPIEDRTGLIMSLVDGEQTFQDVLNKAPIDLKKSLESEFIEGQMASDQMEVNLDNALFYIDAYGKEYEKKFKAAGNYSVLMRGVQDLFTTVQPLPTPGNLDDELWVGLNGLIGADVFEEFISKDKEKAQTKGGRRDFLMDNFTGMYGIAEETYNKIDEALKLYVDNKYMIDFGEVGPAEKFVSAPNEEMRQKLSQSIELLWFLRTGAEVIPGMPRGDINRLGNYLQRAIENEFKTHMKGGDPRMPKAESGFSPREVQEQE